MRPRTYPFEIILLKRLLLFIFGRVYPLSFQKNSSQPKENLFPIHDTIYYNSKDRHIESKKKKIPAGMIDN
jgi:hypothetical protein